MVFLDDFISQERARVPLFLTYRAVGSGTGQKEFVGNAANMLLGHQRGPNGGGSALGVMGEDF